MRLATWTRVGVVFKLKGKAAEGFRQVCKHATEDIFITSGIEGQHRIDSLHPLGLAWDMRRCGFTKRQLKAILGKDFDVISYSWGFHCEYDPK